MSEKDKPPPGSPVAEEEKAIDMDFIKSFLSKTDDRPSKEKDTDDQENVEKTEESNISEKEKTDDKNEDSPSSGKKKKKINKKKFKNKGLYKKKSVRNSSSDNIYDNKETSKEEEEVERMNGNINVKALPPKPAPRKTFNRPPSAPKRRDVDLESIELVSQQNQMSPSYSSSSEPKKSSLKQSKTVPVVHLKQSGTSNYKSARFTLDSDNHVDDVDLELKQKWQLQQRSSRAATIQPAKIEYHDYHSETLKQKYGELQDLLSQEYVQSRKKRSSRSPEVVAYARGMIRKYGFTVSDNNTASSSWPPSSENSNHISSKGSVTNKTGLKPTQKAIRKKKQFVSIPYSSRSGTSDTSVRTDPEDDLRPKTSHGSRRDDSMRTVGPNGDLRPKSSHSRRGNHDNTSGIRISLEDDFRPKSSQGRRDGRSSSRSRSSSWSSSRSRSRSDNERFQQDSSSKDSRDKSNGKTHTYVIDMSKEQDSKHVKFTGEGESEDSSSLDQGSEDILNVERQIALESLSDQQEYTRKSRHVKKKSTSPNVRGKRTDSSASSSASPSRGGRRSYWSTDTATSDSDSSPARSPNRLTDCNLRSSDNVDVIKWLKRKNREIRRRKREERKKKKQEQKEETEKVKDKSLKFADSEKKVKEWMKLKHKESRLLRRKQRKANTMIRVSKSPNQEEARDDMVADGKEKQEAVSCQGAGDKTKEELLSTKGRSLSPKRPYSGHKCKTVEVNMAGVDSKTCTCGYVETQRLKEEELKQTRLAAKMRALQAQRARQAEQAKKAVLRPSSATVSFGPVPGPVSSDEPQRSNSLPNIAQQGKGFKGGKKTKDKSNQEKVALSKEEREKQQKLSYDNWIKRKKEDDKKKREDEARKKEELASSMDDETKEVIRNVGRKRVDNIMQGRKRIDTGIKRIDDTANASIEERIEARKKLGKQSTGGNNKNEDESNNSVFLTQESTSDLPDSSNKEDTDDPAKYVLKKNNRGPLGGRSARPSSARPASAGKRNNSGTRSTRPASAKASFNHNGQKTNKADKVKSDHSNPFILPFPPAPTKHSPRPKVKKRPAYKNVKYQQRSWDEFTDRVWDQVNDQVNEEYGDTVRPEPMGADNPDDNVTATSAGTLTTEPREKREVFTPVDAGEHDENNIVYEQAKEYVASENMEHCEDILLSCTADGQDNPQSVENKTDEDHIETDVVDGDITNTQPEVNDTEPEQRDVKSPEMKEEIISDQIQAEVHEIKEPDELVEEVIAVELQSADIEQEQHELKKIEKEELRLNLEEEEDDALSNDVVTTIPIASTYEPPIREKENSKHKSEKSVRFSDEVETQEYIQSDVESDQTDGLKEQSQNGFGISNEQIGMDMPEGCEENINEADDEQITYLPITSLETSDDGHMTSQQPIDKDMTSQQNIDQSKKDEEPAEEPDLPPGYNPDDSDGEW